MTQPSVDLIFSVAELARLFQHEEGLSQFLHRVVETVAKHMDASVCSVYLLDHKSNDLVLTANVGLSSDSTEKVRLKYGEGITGSALQNLAPILEARGSDNPSFRYFDGIKEEEYQAFLAVPIIKGVKRIGVITVQHQIEGRFSEDDTKTLQAIAMQLASTIESTQLLLSIGSKVSTDQFLQADEPDAECPNFLKGLSGSNGFAEGRATILTGHDNDYLHELALQASGLNLDIDDFNKALKQTSKQIYELERILEEKIGDESAALIFSGHQLILSDEQFSGKIRELIEANTPPGEAILNMVTKYVTIFSQSQNPVLHEKTQDIRDLGFRILHNLVGAEPTARDYQDRIVIATELLPSDILKLSAQGVAGIILLSGSVTAHVSILVRSLELPLVVAGDKRLLQLSSGTNMLIDARQGNIFINPNNSVIERYKELARAHSRADDATDHLEDNTFTQDGTRIRLLANINLCSDLPIARKLKTEGVGLYRTEFPFIIRNDFPSEDEQLAVYRRIIREMEGRPVVFRTLDIGGDKVVSYAPNVEENNPFMGLRAIRFSLKHTDIFCQQLRALLRAAVDAPLHVMFPMIASFEDFLASKELLWECKAKLAAEGIPHCDHQIQTGIMVELPSAVTLIDLLAAEADFLSIGSNDLVQYLLAVDRTNKDIQDLYQPYHPAVLRALHHVTNAAHEHRKPVSICGEIASDQRMLPFLIGIGIRHFSMDPHHVPHVQNMLTGLTVHEAEEVSRNMLACRTTKEVEEVVKELPGCERVLDEFEQGNETV